MDGEREITLSFPTKMFNERKDRPMNNERIAEEIRERVRISTLLGIILLVALYAPTSRPLDGVLQRFRERIRRLPKFRSVAGFHDEPVER